MSEVSECLPNIGNTCFLNATLQSIYAVRVFREMVISDSFLAQETQLAFWLKELFTAMKNGNKTKKQIINGLLDSLTQQDDQYHSFAQDDSVRFIFLIFNRLFQESKGRDIKKIFNLYYKYKCEKCKKTQKISDLVINKWTMDCLNQECGGQMNLELIQKSTALIVLDTQERREIILLKTVGGQEIEYKLKAEVLYSGNGSSGHYVCCRESTINPNRYMVFNDSTIQEEETRKFYRPKHFIYQKVESQGVKTAQTARKRAKQNQTDTSEALSEKAKQNNQLLSQTTSKREHQERQSFLFKLKKMGYAIYQSTFQKLVYSTG